MSQLDDHLQRLARTPVLLVATDYDGTLAPIVSDPAEARPYREAVVALRSMAELPHTQVAVISGRALSDLAELCGDPEDVHLVGSHGSEFDPGFADNLSPDARELRDTLERELMAIASDGPGLAIESKPASIAFHYRNADERLAAQAVKAVLAGPAAHAGVQTRTGKKVIELSVVPTDKGQALEALRQRFGATAALFLGDDVTDEDAFATLSGPDMGIKVGSGDSIATYRIDGPEDVARVLAALSEERQDWTHGAEATPIEAHSILSDLRTVALVAPDTRITWFCAPRIDSPALFADLLGGPNAGTFAIRASDGTPPLKQSYLPGSMLLQTRWKGFSVTDYLDCSFGRPTQRAGRSDLIRVLEGHGRVDIEFSPRLDFGRIETRLEERGDGLEVLGGVDGILLRSEGVRWTIERVGPHQTARAHVDLKDGPVILELRYGAVNLQESVRPERERQRSTQRFWTEWSDRLVLPTIESDLVQRSALILRALTYGPTGAISAAGTTSLPEHLGGVRNWDYRFCWLRDGALSAEALVRLGSFREAMSFLDWVLGVLDQLPHPERMRPLYTVTGGELGSEAELTELPGYGGSRPVRVGNAAAQQVQLDVFGPIVHLLWCLCEAGAPLSTEHWGLALNMVQAVSARWEEPDHGIWEIRGAPRHHVHSKVMCWMTLDRAVSIAQRFRGMPVPEWAELRDRIAQDVITHGWNPRLGAFGAAYGSEDLDAASLWVGLSGLLEPSDERFVRTVEAVQAKLADGPTVYRYLCDDGLPGREGGFHLCASWLIDSLILIGRVDAARRLFLDLGRLAGPTGCLSEEYDPETRLALGNHPQAYSHLGLIHNALNLEQALRGKTKMRSL